ncbi:hypothetical protein RU639_007028 [Aspergillus parasiticus]
MPQTLVLITGANQGLGYSTAEQLAKTGKYHILVGARTKSKAQSAIQQLVSDPTIDSSTLTPLVIDANDDTSIAAAAKSVSDQFGSLDILINNAAISKPQDPNLSLRDSFRAVFETNVFGVAVIVDAFLPLLRASKYHDRRIVNVTTGLAQMSVAYSPTSEYGARRTRLPEYRSSKAALNMLTAVEGVTLEKENILVVSTSPGYCRTNFTGGYGVKDANQGAMNIVRAATEGDPKTLLGTIVAEECRVEDIGW